MREGLLPKVASVRSVKHRAVKHRALVPDQRQDMQDQVLPQLLTPNRKMWTKP